MYKNTISPIFFFFLKKKKKKNATPEESKNTKYVYLEAHINKPFLHEKKKALIK
jgi:hypothetical protein